MMVSAKKASGGVAVGGKTKISHVVQNEKIFLVLGEGLHQGRHSKVILLAAIYIPGGRMNPIGFEKSHEPRRRVRRAQVARAGIGFHQVQERQRKESPCSPEKGSAFNFPVSTHSLSYYLNTISRKDALLATSIKSSFQLEFSKVALTVILSTTP